MIRRPLRSTRTYQRLPSTPLFRSPGREWDCVGCRCSPTASEACQRNRRSRAGHNRLQAYFVSFSKLARPDAGRWADRRDGLERAANREARSEEPTSELQSLMRISYDVFRLKKKKYTYYTPQEHNNTSSASTSRQTIY